VIAALLDPHLTGLDVTLVIGAAALLLIAHVKGWTR
jgi:hypothetical protein